MEEDRQFIRLLIEKSREETIKLFDDTLNEFDRLSGPALSKSKYHAKYAIKRYNYNLGVVRCKVRRTMTFIIRMINAFKINLNQRYDKARILNKVYEDAKKKANEIQCSRRLTDE